MFRDLALMLSVTENEIRAAMGVKPSYGPFEIPPRAQALDLVERAAVIGIIDAILHAKRGGGTDVGSTGQKSPDPTPGGGGSSAGTGEPQKKRVRGHRPRMQAVDDLPPLDQLAADHQDGPSAYEQMIADQDRDETGSQDRGSDDPA